MLINQSRVQGENLQLTSNPKVASRWVISPTADNTDQEPLAGSLLNAFGAFVAKVFREHDYQLGRRNCQQFLRKNFGLPWDNVVMRDCGLSPETIARLDKDFGFTADDTDDRLFQLIPLMDNLKVPVTVTREPIKPSELDALCETGVQRLKEVAKRLIGQSGGGFGLTLGLNTVWLVLGEKIHKALFDYASGELKQNGFLE